MADANREREGAGEQVSEGQVGVVLVLSTGRSRVVRAREGMRRRPSGCGNDELGRSLQEEEGKFAENPLPVTFIIFTFWSSRLLGI